MSNDFETKFAGWPVRYFVLSEDQKLLLISEPNNSELDITKLFEFLGK